MQAYSDPSRENNTHALPDVEVFRVPEDVPFSAMGEDDYEVEPGWYWWSCFPGCLPDGDPMGPFATESEALADAREGQSE